MLDSYLDVWTAKVHLMTYSINDKFPSRSTNSNAVTIIVVVEFSGNSPTKFDGFRVDIKRPSNFFRDKGNFFGLITKFSNENYRRVSIKSNLSWDLK